MAVCGYLLSDVFSVECDASRSLTALPREGRTKVQLKTKVKTDRTSREGRLKGSASVSIVSRKTILTDKECHLAQRN